jgi:hypothetical protein
VKQTSGRCAVGVEMKRRRTWPNANCPRCTETQETSTHVLRCQGEGTEAIWTKFISEFRLWLARQRTNNDITEAICLALSRWRSGGPKYSCRSNLPGLRQAVLEQDDIGWDGALEGRWSSSWIEIQERHFTFIHLRRSGKRWLTAIIKQLWNVSWDLWDHRNNVNIENKEKELRLANAIKIRNEYSLGPEGLDKYDRKMFSKSLAVTLTMQLPKQDAWLRRVTLARRRSASNTLHIVQANLISFYNTLARIRRRNQPRQSEEIINQPTTGLQAPVPRSIVRIPRFPPADAEGNHGVI